MEEIDWNSIQNIGIYARVSTEDKDQNPENQLQPLRKFAEEHHKPYKEYIDYESGKEMDVTQRKHFIEMFEDLKRNVIDAIFVKRPDRFSRSNKDGAVYIRLFKKLHKYLYVYDRDKWITAKSRQSERWMFELEELLAERASIDTGDRVKDAYERKVRDAATEAQKLGVEAKKIRWGRKKFFYKAGIEEVTLPTGAIRKKWIMKELDPQLVIQWKREHPAWSLRDLAKHFGCSDHLILIILRKDRVNSGTVGVS